MIDVQKEKRQLESLSNCQLIGELLALYETSLASRSTYDKDMLDLAKKVVIGKMKPKETRGEGAAECRGDR